jgi:hypothetical protein
MALNTKENHPPILDQLKNLKSQIQVRVTQPAKPRTHRPRPPKQAAVKSLSEYKAPKQAKPEPLGPASASPRPKVEAPAEPVKKAGRTFVIKKD